MKEIVIANLKEDEIPSFGTSPLILNSSNELSDIVLKMINEDDVDGSKITDLLFKVKSADVFISYSHNNGDCAKKLAQFFTHFGVKVFLDCLSWDSSDKFLEQIDKEFAYDKNTNTYNYKIRNRTTAHAHVMLSNALMQQIAKSKYLIILNPNIRLINKTDIINKTGSPWIYEEIIFARTLIEHNRDLSMLEHMEARDNEPVPITYKLPIDDCAQITADRLKDAVVYLSEYPPNDIDELMKELYE